MRLDHHCFWMGNCIGLYNFRHFNLYIFYLMLSNLYIGLLMTDCFTMDPLELIDMMFYSLNVTAVTCTSLGLSFCMLIFLCINMRFLICNQTGYELQFEPYLTPYKKSSCSENVKQMYVAKNIWEAFLPINPNRIEYSQLIIPTKL